MNTTFLIIGGGISGVSCAETISLLCPNESITLITESSLIKTVTNLIPLAKYVTSFDIIETNSKDYTNEHIQVITDRLNYICSREKFILTENGVKIFYKFLCLCTGARPNVIKQNTDVDEYILGIRDTESVIEFQKRIEKSKKIVILGNGGIASELVYELKGIHIDWIIKDDFITSKFIDAGAAKFFSGNILNKQLKNENLNPVAIKRMRYEELKEMELNMKKGAALGPDWHRKFNLIGKNQNEMNLIEIHYSDEINFIKKNPFGSKHPISIELKNSKKLIECDLIVSATGVNPNLNFTCDEEFKLGPDGGIFVDWEMRSSVSNIYAAGDICYAGWEISPHWFQMRLWTQARQMGMMAGKAISASFSHEQIYQDFCFELFTHVTKLFGYQVVLLGKFNGQGLNDQYEIILRCTPEKEYIKFVLHNGRLHGAILIGDTGLEETVENLILNQIDLTPYGEDILNPDIDIEDYFD